MTPIIPLDEFFETPGNGIVDPNRINEASKIAVPYEEAAILLIARFVNFAIANFLGVVSSQLITERSIREKHLLKNCDKLPYPLNLYFC